MKEAEKKMQKKKELFCSLFHSLLRRTNINFAFESVILTFRCLFICHILEPFHERVSFFLHLLFVIKSIFLHRWGLQTERKCWRWSDKFSLNGREEISICDRRYRNEPSEKYQNSFTFHFFLIPRPLLISTLESPFC